MTDGNNEPEFATELPTVLQVIRLMIDDQGGLERMSEKFTLPEQIDWERVERILAQLTEEDLETISVGDQEDMMVIVQRLGTEGDYVHEALDELYMIIGG
jgi:hypothetical protein